MLTLHCVETYRRIEVLISRADGLRFFGAGGIGAGVIRVLETALESAEMRRNETTRTKAGKLESSTMTKGLPRPSTT